MDWKITATTLFCDTVKKWVPIWFTKTEKPIALLLQAIKSSPKRILAGFPVMDPRDVGCARLIRKMFFSRVGK